MVGRREKKYLAAAQTWLITKGLKLLGGWLKKKFGGNK